MADKVIDSLANRQVRSYDKEVTTRLYISHISSPNVDNCPRLCLGHLPTFELDTLADMKTAV